MPHILDLDVNACDPENRQKKLIVLSASPPLSVFDQNLQHGECFVRMPSSSFQSQAQLQWVLFSFHLLIWNLHQFTSVECRSAYQMVCWRLGCMAHAKCTRPKLQVSAGAMALHFLLPSLPSFLSLSIWWTSPTSNTFYGGAHPNPRNHNYGNYRTQDAPLSFCTKLGHTSVENLMKNDPCIRCVPPFEDLGGGKNGAFYTRVITVGFLWGESEGRPLQSRWRFQALTQNVGASLTSVLCWTQKIWRPLLCSRVKL